MKFEFVYSLIETSNKQRNNLFESKYEISPSKLICHHFNILISASAGLIFKDSEVQSPHHLPHHYSLGHLRLWDLHTENVSRTAPGSSRWRAQGMGLEDIEPPAVATKTSADLRRNSEDGRRLFWWTVWGKGDQTLYSHINLSLNVGCPRKASWPWARKLCLA